MRRFLVLAITLLVLLFLPIRTPAQETPTERDAASGVVHKLDSLQRSLGISALVTRLTAANPAREAVVARAKALMDQELLALGDDITRHPEIGFEETRSVQLLTDYLRKHDFDVQIGHLDPSFLPGKAQAWKPSPAAEDQAQQQRVNQQREQQRIRQSPALRPRGGCRRVAEAGGAQACPAATSSASDNLIAQPGFVPPQALEVFFEDIQHIVLIPPRLACRVRGDEGVGQVP